MKLSAEHFPFPCSLRELVLDHYADPLKQQAAGAHFMAVPDLREYLKNTDNFDLSPWASLQAQTDAMGDPAQPSPDQAGIIQWLGKALEHWERDYPIEEPLAAMIRSLKPLCAALAVLDPDFLVPGAHSLHRLLDSIQSRAVGWQSDLDRVGTHFEQQVAKTVRDAREWFEDEQTDLAAVFERFATGVERDESRARRMAQRVVDAETGKVRTQAAKLDAARMINSAIANCEVPEEIDAFIKGPWFTSAQLLILKFGTQSEQWAKMGETTETLLDSLQTLEDASDERRQYVFKIVTQLPREMRRWLLSLHHDTEAVNEAMGLVEYTHLRILRRQPVDLVQLSPIVLAEQEIASANTADTGQANYAEGEWFSIRQEKGKPLRAQLVLITPGTGDLLFTNLAGIKVLQLERGDFEQLLASGKVTPLDYGQSFSRSLAKAAGIESAELLSALEEALGALQAGGLDSAATSPATESVPAPNPPPPAEPPLPEQSPPPVSTTPAATPPVTAPPAETLATATGPAGDFAVPTTDNEPLLAPELDERPTALVAAAPAAGHTTTEDAAAQDTVTLESEELPETVLSAPTSQVGATPETETGVLSRGFSPELAIGDGFLAEQAQKLRELQPAAEEQEIIEITPVHPFQQPPPEPAAEPEQAQPLSPAENAEPQERELQLPIGTWLGFHDEDTPTMGRLAMHDPDADQFVFVNRKGIRLRSLSYAALRQLIEDGLVDILQHSSNLREQITDVRNSLDPGKPE